MASMMLEGKMCSRTELKVAGLCGMAASARCRESKCRRRGAQVHRGQPQQQRQGGDNLEIQDGLAADAAMRFMSPPPRCHHQRRED